MTDCVRRVALIPPPSVSRSLPPPPCCCSWRRRKHWCCSSAQLMFTAVISACSQLRRRRWSRDLSHASGTRPIWTSLPHSASYKRQPTESSAHRTIAWLYSTPPPRWRHAKSSRRHWRRLETHPPWSDHVTPAVTSHVDRRAVCRHAWLTSESLLTRQDIAVRVDNWYCRPTHQA